MEKGEEKPALWRYCVEFEKHDAEQQEFKMSVIGVHGNDDMLIQIAQSVRIGKVPGVWLMNSMREWNYFSSPRAMIEDT